MKPNNILVTPLTTFAIITLIFAGILLIFNIVIDKWTKDVYQSNQELTEIMVPKLGIAAEKLLDSLWATSFFQNESLSKLESSLLNHRLQELTKSEFANIQGMEGGFYLLRFEDFFGYAFPTSPPPVPAYGPAPRSYNIIRDQIFKSIIEDKLIVDIHQFDPAIFPLATQPLRIRSNTLGGIWARIHVERQLPFAKLTQLFQIASVLSLLGFIFAITAARYQHNRMKEIKSGLETIRTNINFRFVRRRGVFGFISQSINEMVDNLTNEHKHRQFLERELHHREKMATLGKLIAGVAHEVKTPLAIIKTRVQMWQRDLKRQALTSGTAKVISEESVHLVVHEINRLTLLVNRLLGFSRPISNKLRPADLNQLITQVLAMTQEKINEYNIVIKTDYESNVPKVNIDVFALEQVLLNIIFNAIEAMPEGGILNILTKYFTEERYIEITIQDTGVGIPAELLENFFNPFFTTKDKGIGLGLFISNEIIKGHGGKIEFSKANPKGTICKLIIPLKISKELSDEI